MSAALSVFKLRVQNVCQLQQHRIESKSLSKWQNCLISELPWQIIPYQWQDSLQLGTVGWFWHM